MNEKNRKILFFVSEDWYFISHRLKLALFLLNKGYQIHLCCKNTGFVEEILKHGINWHSIEVKRKSLSICQFFKEVIKLYFLIHKLKPEIIQLISLRQIVVGVFSAMLFRKKKIFLTFTGLGFLFTEKDYKTYFIRLLIRCFLFLTFKLLNLKAIVQNEDDKKFISKNFFLSSIKISVIKGSGIDLKHFRLIPESFTQNITLAYAGRLLKDKGILDLVEAFKSAKIELKNLSLILAGPLDKNNPSAISDKELDRIKKIKDIHYLGNVKDTRMIWKKANIAILLSKREGLPLSLMEAAAVGRSIIATDVPGCREIAKDGLNSITVPFGNIEKIKNAILKLANDRKLRKRYSQFGRKILEKEMKQEIIFSKYLTVYENKKS